MTTFNSISKAASTFVNQNLNPVAIYSAKRQALHNLGSLINQTAPKALSDLIHAGHQALYTPIYNGYTPAFGFMCGTAAYSGILAAAVLTEPKRIKQLPCKALAVLTVSTVNALAAVTLAKNPEELILAGNIALTVFAACALSVCCTRAAEYCKRAPKPAQKEQQPTAATTKS